MRRYRQSVILAGVGALLLTGSATGPGLAAPEGKKSGAPSYRSAWTMELPSGARRVAVADVTADKRPRLLVLDGEGTLSIRKLSREGATEEAKVALGAGAERFVVGRFDRGGPAQIVVPNAVFHREGESYRKKAIPDLPEVHGSVRFADGSEEIISTVGDGPPISHALDLGAEKLLKPGRELAEPTPEGGTYREIVLHLSAEMFEAEPFPVEVKRGSLARLFVPRSGGRLYGVFSWQATDGSHVAVVDSADLFPDAKADMKPLWKSPKLSGKVLDIALGPDPRGGAQPGLLVLTAAGDDGKGRRVEFFALES